MIKKTVAFGIFFLVASTALAPMQSGAQQSASAAGKPKHVTPQQLELDLEQLSDKYEQLEREMSAMKADSQRREAELQSAETKAKEAQAEIDALKEQQSQEQQNEQTALSQNGEAVAALQSSVTDLKSVASSVVGTIQSNQERAETPNAIPFMGIHLKPGGFLAAETVDRQHGIGGDVNTQFSGIPFSGQTASYLSEFNASARQSRVSLLAEGKLSGATLRGYFEGDFLSAGVTSNDNQSNSYTFRVRQAWAQAALNSGWFFTGGQMWSLATEYRSGLLNNREAIPQTIDAQYTVGFTWERQYGFRVVKQISNQFWAGMSVEEAQTLNLGGHNLPAIVYQQAGNSGGLYNSTANYSFNFVPDLVAKFVYEPRFGHFEVFSVGRTFRARAFPDAAPMLTTTSWGPTSPSTIGAFTSKTLGGGLGANARVYLLDKRLEVAAHGLAGNGIGRYSSSTFPDATAHPDGSLELLVGGSALGSLEYHATSRLDLYAYYGGEYAKRAYYDTGYVVTTTPTNIYMPPVGQPILGGYGAPTNIVVGCQIEVVPATTGSGSSTQSTGLPGTANGCTADNRNIQEGTTGYWFRFYKGPKGTFQQGIQYSYAVRHTWQGVGMPANPVTGAPEIPGSPKAIDNMWFTSFRYYLPQ